MSDIPRANPFLNEAIEQLHLHYMRYRGNAAEAEANLTNSEREFIDAEVLHCMQEPRYYLENYHVVKTESQGLKTLFPFWESQEIFYNEVRKIQLAGGPVKVQCLKARQQGLCLDPNTRVLTADLLWVRLKDLVEGQEIVAVDEEVNGPNRPRKMRTATVVAKSSVYETAYKVTFDNGQQVICTKEHRWLCRNRANVHTLWRPLSRMKIGDRVRCITEPWEESSYEDGWFGGFMDGEATFRHKRNGCSVAIPQVEGAALDRARNYLQSRSYFFKEYTDKNKANASKFGSKPLTSLEVCRMNQMFRLMGQTRPSRVARARWWEGKELPGKRTGYGWTRIVSIEELPKQNMIDLQTTTGTFIAEGLVSHNSTISQGLVFQKTIFTPAMNMLTIAQDGSQAAFLFDMARTAYDCLPWWMQPEKRYEQAGKFMEFDRVDEFLRQNHPGLKSKIFVEAANKPTGAARGKTIRAMHASELASWDDGGQLTKSLFPTMNADDTLAIMESTAEGRSGFWYQFWRETIAGKTDWHPIFIEFFRVKKYSRPFKTTADVDAFHRSQHEEDFVKKVKLEKNVLISDETLNWMRKKKQEFIATDGDEFSFYGEYPATWQEAFQGTGICAFPKRKLQKILETTVCTPKFVGEIRWDEADQIIKFSSQDFGKKLRKVRENETLKNPEVEGDERFRVWAPPEEGEEYYVAVDVAMGVEGGDYACVQCMKIGIGMQPDEQVAEWRGWINPTPLAYVAVGIARWYGMAQIACEVNNVGLTTNNEIQRVIEYDNIYRWKHIDKIKGMLTDHTGWYTNFKTRDVIITKMSEAIQSNTVILRSEWLIDEMLDFASEEDGGKYQGQDTNDDRVMTMMIVHYCAHESDFGKKASTRPMTGKHGDGKKYYVMDVMNRKIGDFEDRDKAIELVAQNPGYSFVQAPEARDFANTAYSPIHNGAGMQNRMYYEMGYAAEEINHGSIAEAEAMEDPESGDSSDAWKYY